MTTKTKDNTNNRLDYACNDYFNFSSSPTNVHLQPQIGTVTVTVGCMRRTFSLTSDFTRVKQASERCGREHEMVSKNESLALVLHSQYHFFKKALKLSNKRQLVICQESTSHSKDRNEDSTFLFSSLFT